MSKCNVKPFEPFLTRETKEKIDRYVESKIGKDSDGIAILSYKKTFLEPLFPGLSRYNIAIAISAYVDLVRDKWHAEYHRTSNNPYYLTAYRPGQAKDQPTRIYPGDFAEINGYLSQKLQEQKITLVSDKMLTDNGYVLFTSYRQMWLLMNTFFGMHPEYHILGVMTRYNPACLRYETLYMVTPEQSREVLSQKDIKGLFKYLLHGRFPREITSAREVPRPVIRIRGDLEEMLPVEADILEIMRDSPVTVRELVREIPLSETLIRLALKRLYVKGLIAVIGRKEGGRGRSPFVFQARADGGETLPHNQGSKNAVLR